LLSFSQAEMVLPIKTYPMNYSKRILLLSLLFSFSAVLIHAQNWRDLATFEPDPFETNARELFGECLDMDGQYAVVGARTYMDSKGCAYVLKYESGIWTTIARLTASDGEAVDYLGAAVAIEGNTIVVASGTKPKVYLYEMPAGGWTDMTETLQLTPQDAFGRYYGTAVDIENDLIAVSDPGTGNGKVFLFEKTGANWTSDPEIAILSPTTGSSDYDFGEAIDIHGDLIAVGEPSRDKGYVYLFHKPTEGWTDMAPEHTLSFSGALTNSKLGQSIKICDEYITAGSYKSAAVFEKPAEGWKSMTETAILSGSVADNDAGLGYSVAAEDNTIVLANIYYESEGIQSRGGLFFYERSGDHWTDMTETFIQTASDAEVSDNLGCDVAMQGDTLLAGAKRNSDNGPLAGSAYAFARTGTKWSDGTSEQLILPKPGLNTIYARFGTSAAIDGNTAVIGIPGYQNDEGAVCVLEWNGSQWEKVALLTPDEPEKGAKFGFSVDIYQDTIIVGEPYRDDPDGGNRKDVGWAYLFYKDGAEWSDMHQKREYYYSTTWQEGRHLGHSVAYGNGLAVVGAPGEDADFGSGNVEDIGMVYVFDPGPTYAKVLSMSDYGSPALDYTRNYQFGNALSMDETTVAVSAIGANGGVGAVYVYEGIDAGFTNIEETAILTPSDGSSGDRFGSDVDTDGNSIIVGAVDKDSPEYNTGGAYVYVKSTSWTTTTETAILTPSLTYNKTWGEKVAIDGSVALISGNGMRDVLVYEASDWSSPAETGLINFPTSFSGAMRAPAIDLDNNTAIIGYQGYSGSADNAGMATVFERFTYPATQAADISVSSSSSSDINISWTNGSGEGQLVFMKAAGSGSPGLTDNTSYTANTKYGSGSEVDGWYCVFNGDDSSCEVDVTGLSPETTYRIAVYSFNGEDGNNLILQDDGTNNPANFTTGIDLDGVGYHVANGELTNTTTGMEYEIGGSGTWTACSDGTTEGVVFTEGKVIVRQASDIGNTYIVADLIAPAAPAFTIDYENETTAETVTTTIEYNSDNDFGTANTVGTDVVVDVVPGTDLYFRYMATETDLPSLVQTLVVADRPAAPAVGIDYVQEQTDGNLPVTVEYAENSDFTTGKGTGTNAPLALIPGTDLWFRIAASNTEENFYGESQQLVVPARPAAPSFGIDYEAETTLEVIPDTVEYASDANFTSGLEAGSGTTLTITPGAQTWFRYKASNTNEFFTSEAQQLTAPDRPAAPTYTIDYEAETTSENIPETVEYAEDSEFTTALQAGDDSPAELTPGTNLWFRIKASNTGQRFAGNAQALSVPSRPDPLAYTIYYSAERTWEAAYNYIQWAEDADFTVNAETGNGSVIYLTPGNSLYIRRLARPAYNQFKSEAFFLEVPARPAAPVFTIDYINEKTNEVVPDTIRYSYNYVNSLGENQTINLTPGWDVDFHIVAAEPGQNSPGNFAGEVFTLELPDRPQPPAFEIDFMQEQTTEIVPDTVEYRINYSATIDRGEGSHLSLEPGTTVLLRYAATTTHFRGLEQTLSIPARPQPPAFDIDFMQEQTTEIVPDTVQYRINGSPTIYQGDGSKLSLEPGTTVFFSFTATASHFRSMEQTLAVADRPQAPSFSIDYISEETNEDVPFTVEYSVDAGISWVQADGNPVALTPGTDYLFHYKATDEQFQSTAQNMEVHERPDAPTSPVVDDSVDIFDWTFTSSFQEFSHYEYSTDAGTSWEGCTEKPLQIGNVDLLAGELMVRVAASNQSGMERFAGIALASDADFTVSTGINTTEADKFLLYPNPVTEYLMFQTPSDYQLEAVRIISPSGKVLLHVADIHSSESLDVSAFSPGLYIVEIEVRDQLIRKIIVKN
jgi:hypothetical protein